MERFINGLLSLLITMYGLQNYIILPYEQKEAIKPIEGVMIVGDRSRYPFVCSSKKVLKQKKVFSEILGEARRKIGS